jgi:hypothetical protein
MQEIIVSEFGGSVFQFDARGWFNATGAAVAYGKQAPEWLRLPSTMEYLRALGRRYGEIPYVEASRARVDRGGGTWLHPKLAVAFARWLDVDFAVWCDEQIDSIMRGHTTQQFAIWRELQAVIAKDEGSKVRASFGSHLMLKRKREKPVLQEQIGTLSRLIQPSLLN